MTLPTTPHSYRNKNEETQAHRKERYDRVDERLEQCPGPIEIKGQFDRGSQTDKKGADNYSAHELVFRIVSHSCYPFASHPGILYRTNAPLLARAHHKKGIDRLPMPLIYLNSF